MNRSTKIGLLIGYGMALLSIIGCSEPENQNNPIIRKGVIVNKEFIASHWVKISSTKVSYKIPDVYCITLQGTKTVKSTHGEYSVNTSTIFTVTSSIFGESDIGREVDFTGNPNVDVAQTCASCPSSYTTTH